MKIGLISCSKKKQNKDGPAYRVYSASTLFNKAYGYAVKNYDKVMILSAKYALIIPDRWIEPYDETLSKMSKGDRFEWATKVINRITAIFPEGAELYLHAGARYREHLTAALPRYGFKCFVPLEGLGIGEQLKWYTDRMQGLKQTTL